MALKKKIGNSISGATSMGPMPPDDVKMPIGTLPISVGGPSHPSVSHHVPEVFRGKMMAAHKASGQAVAKPGYNPSTEGTDC